jgi:hypothetical protein
MAEYVPPELLDRCHWYVAVAAAGVNAPLVSTLPGRSVPVIAPIAVIGIAVTGPLDALVTVPV